MSRQAFSGGLSDSIFSWDKAVVTGLVVALLFVAVNETWHRLDRRFTADPKLAPPCFGADEPIKPGRERLSPFDSSVHARNDAHDLASLTEASRLCTVQACDTQAFKQYRSALFGYLGSRTIHLRVLERTYGAEGLARARRDYANPADAAIERGFKERYAAGRFKIGDFRYKQDVLTIFALSGGNALRACRVTEVTKR